MTPESACRDSPHLFLLLPGINLAHPTYMAKKSTSSKDKYTDPKLREEVKEDVKKSGKGGRPGQWSARKGTLRVKPSY